MPDLPARAAAFEQTFPLGSEQLTHEQISQLELDSFQVALVPFQSPAVSPGRHLARNIASHLVLLPVTWKQLMVQVRKETDGGAQRRKRNETLFVSARLVSTSYRWRSAARTASGP